MSNCPTQANTGLEWATRQKSFNTTFLLARSRINEEVKNRLRCCIHALRSSSIASIRGTSHASRA